jgi:hypothetical protein
MARLHIHQHIHHFGHIAIGKIGHTGPRFRVVQGGGRRRIAHVTPRRTFSLRQAASAFSAAPRMALPAIQVMREADEEPESPLLAVSDASTVHLV